MLKSVPVMASKPVANTIASSSYSARVEPVVLRRYVVVRGALEHPEVRGLRGHLGDHLHPGGARADHAHAQLGEVDLVVGPGPRVVPSAPEILQAAEVGHVGRRDAPDRGDQVGRSDAVAGVGADLPLVASFVVQRLGDPGVELDVAAQVHPVGDPLEILQDFRLGGVALAPRPFLQELFRQVVGEAVEDALRVAAGPGIAVPVPRAADVCGRLVDPGRQPQLAGAVQHVEAGVPGPDDDGVEIGPPAVLGVRESLPELSHGVPSVRSGFCSLAGACAGLSREVRTPDACAAPGSTR